MKFILTTFLGLLVSVVAQADSAEQTLQCQAQVGQAIYLVSVTQVGQSGATYSAEISSYPKNSKLLPIEDGSYSGITHAKPSVYESANGAFTLTDTTHVTTTLSDGTVLDTDVECSYEAH